METKNYNFQSIGLNYLTLATPPLQSGVFRAVLVTHGRKTGKEHSVQLRAVIYEDKIYCSRRNENSDWLKNALADPHVRVEIDGKTYSGVSSLVTDKSLAQKISQLKYPGQERASDVRIVLQITPTN